MQNWKLTGSVCLVATFGLVLVLSGPSPAAETGKPAAKPKAAAKSVAPKTKSADTKYQSAETAGKAPVCFGMAPGIEKVSPDEGKAGDKVTITGTNFGNSDCLRSVSFGPGHAATFKIESDSKISTTVPSGGRKGLAMLTVTTASGEASKTFLVK
ncbi:MAG: IPT/TIG domain-containing protein [Nitrospira sp.]|nr:IPT/TIG domain-containing protein [Nitrospira sp.]